MFHIPDLCRICLQGDSKLNDITRSEGGAEPLISKLKLCVAEVEWPLNVSVMLCATCVIRLNAAFEFRKQCLESTQTLQAVTQMVIKPISTNKAATLDERKTNFVHIKPAPPHPTAAIPIPGLPNIVVTPAQTKVPAPPPTPNILLNLIPSKNLPPATITTPTAADANQNMFVHINNALHKVFPVVTHTKDGLVTQPVILKTPVDDVNITRILTESKSEELSVEVDPNCFDCDEEHVMSMSEGGKEPEKDWEDLIQMNKIVPGAGPVFAAKPEQPQPRFETKPESMEVDNGYVHFMQSDHFMAPFIETGHGHGVKSFMCEQCGQACASLKALKSHIKLFHLGKFPYKCGICAAEYAVGAQFELHMQTHFVECADESRDTYTLDDFNGLNVDGACATDAQKQFSSIRVTEDGSLEGDASMFEFKCAACPRKSFSTAHGLASHKVRKHDQKARKKYFIKGMKNAKCEICNREFSTQSYLQLHIKLHYRKMDYRLKVFDKMKAAKERVETDDAANRVKTEIEESVEDVEEASSADKSTRTMQRKRSIRRVSAENEHEVVKVESDDESRLQIDEDRGLSDSSDGARTENGPQSAAAIEPQPDDVQEAHTLEGCNLADVLELKKTNSLQAQLLALRIELIAGQAKCFFCSALFRRADELKQHLNDVHLKSIQYHCHLCSTQFFSLQQLLRHLRHHTGAVRCVACDREFVGQVELKAHLDSSHNSEVSGSVQCTACNQEFEKWKRLQEHFHGSNKCTVLKCHLCDASFNEQLAFADHVVQHSGLHMCNVCKTTFVTEDELEIHRPLHRTASTTGNKIQCPICQAKYKKEKYLRIHITQAHSGVKSNQTINAS